MELPSTRGAATCSKKVGNGNGLTDPRRKKLVPAQLGLSQW
jgi:hypothetical protein